MLRQSVRCVMAVALGAIGALSSAPALAQYPNKPIEMIVPWPAGVGADAAARVLSQALSKRLGVPVQVVNKPGAGAVTGTNEFVHAKPDGYTIGSINIGPAVTQIIGGNAPYDFEDMVPIGLFNVLPFVVMAKSDAPFKTMKELAQFSKSAGRGVIVGNFGPGAVPTQTMVRMAGTDGWKPKLVTFPAPGWTQLQSGDADVVTVEYNVVAGQLKAGQARALVAMTPVRLGGLPQVPTVKEMGYGFDVSIWTGLFAPKGTPSEIVQKLSTALKDAVADQAVRDFAEKSSTIWEYQDPDQTKARIKLDEAWVKPVMRELGLIKRN